MLRMRHKHRWVDNPGRGGVGGGEEEHVYVALLQALSKSDLTKIGLFPIHLKNSEGDTLVD